MWLNLITILLMYMAFLFGVFFLAFYLLVRDKEKRFYKNLEEKLKSDNPFDRISAIIRISSMGIKSKEFIPKLVELLEDKNTDVIENAQTALIRIKDNLEKTKNEYNDVLNLLHKSIPKKFLSQFEHSLELNNNAVKLNTFSIKKSNQNIYPKVLGHRRGKKKK